MQDAPERVVYYASIVTMDPERPAASAVAIGRGRNLADATALLRARVARVERDSGANGWVCAAPGAQGPGGPRSGRGCSCGGC